MRTACVALLAAAPAFADGANFGAGAWFSAPSESVAHKDAGISFELRYLWPHASAGVDLFASGAFGNLTTSFVSARGAWVVLDAAVSPYLGAGIGFFGQTLHCNAGQSGCLPFSSSGAAGALEVGLLLWRRVAASAQWIEPVTRSQPAVFPAVEASPIPLLLVGVRVLG